MLARLGNVLYWAGTGIAALCVIGGGAFAISIYNYNRADAYFIGALWLVSAAVIWLIGRACRYVLAGR